jgi:hypothetical protein
MSHRLLSVVSATCLALTWGLLVTPGHAQVTSARSELYSQWAVDRFCSVAQQITTGTPYYSYNLVHSSLDSFTASSSAPYEGANLSAYNGKGTDGGSLPLTTQQFVSHRVLTGTTWEYPIVISCKMKTAEAINFHFGAGAAGTQLTCREVNQATVADVYASLTSVEQRMLRWGQSQIVYRADTYAIAGPGWLYPLPFLPRVATVPTTGADAGKLVLRGLAITVDRSSPATDAGPDKKGSYYCHLPSPEYIRALITGQTQPIIENPPE